jgi:TRAP-type C4-dicarboxylate transport system substrate-binding protein
MKKILLSAMIATALSTGLIPVVMAQSDNNFKFAHTFPETSDDFRHVMALQFSEELKKAGLNVEVIGNQRLLAPRAQWQGLVQNNTDFVASSIADITNFREFEIINMPGLLTDKNMVRAFVKSKAATMLDEEAAKRGVRIVGWWPQPLSLGSTGSCIDTPEKMKGQTVRGNGSMQVMIEAAGGFSANVPAPDIGKAMEAGALDAVNSTIQVFYVNKLQGKLKCVVTPADGRAMGYILTTIKMSGKRWSALDEATREKIRVAAHTVGEWAMNQAETENVRFAEEFRKTGSQVLPFDGNMAGAWRAAAMRTAIPQYRGISETTAAIVSDVLSLR